ncbi:MAG: peptidoglycan-binding domain-containing protein, partial [Pseudomonadota bacterium]
FNPPTESKQPTLRKGDENADGWVEYLQTMLNKLDNAGIGVDGQFGNGTYKAVIAFQKKNCKAVDGIVGNETWAALRGAPPEKPSTDGREPHTYEETGREGRWMSERSTIATYDAKADKLVMLIVSLGDEPIDDAEATVQVHRPDGSKAVETFKIGRADRTSGSDSGGGDEHSLKISKAREVFDLPDGTDLTTLEIEAYLPAELGGDYWKGKPVAG